MATHGILLENIGVLLETVRTLVKNIAMFQANGGMLLENRVTFQGNEGALLENVRILLENVVIVNSDVPRKTTIAKLLSVNDSVNTRLENILPMHISLITLESMELLIVYLDFVQSGYQFTIPN